MYLQDLIKVHITRYLITVVESHFIATPISPQNDLLIHLKGADFELNLSPAHKRKINWSLGDVSSQNLDPLIVFGTELVLNDDNCRPDEHKDLMTNEAITGDKETLVKSSNTKLYMLHYSKHFGYNYGSTADCRTRLLARLNTEKSQATSTLARGAI